MAAVVEWTRAETISAIMSAQYVVRKNVIARSTIGHGVKRLAAGIGIYAFALLSRYENTIKGTLLNAVRLAMGHIPRSLAMAAIWAVWAVFLWYIHGIALLVYVIYGLSIPAGACTLLYDPIFQKMEEDMEEDPEADTEDDQQ